jgi:hypothetical protein
MLPQEFFDWWFEPWAYAADAACLHPVGTGRVGQRDGYRLWCDQADVAAELPPHFDTEWHVVAAIDGAQLIATARLFGGLFAARRHDQALLNELAFDERKWCVSIAATQPLSAVEGLPNVRGVGIAAYGLVELVRRLEFGFPGMWSRLRLLLPQDLVGKTEELLGVITRIEQKREASATRAQRCWALCETRAALLQEAQPLAA